MTARPGTPLNDSMSAKTATCITCARPLAPDETVSGFCPRCLYSAGRLPLTACTPTEAADALTSSWSNAFPQFEAQQELREEDGFLALSGTLLSDDFPNGYGPACLLIWSGPALAAESGADVLLAHLDTLRLAACPGVASIVDAGDLTGGVYLLAKLPEGTIRWDAQGSGSSPSQPELSCLLPELGRVTAAVRATCGVDLLLDPNLLFLDREGLALLVPRPTSRGSTETSGSGHSTGAAAANPHPGLEIGPYTLVKRIGEGGFGEVWEARQERPATRTVAIKILKHGLSSPRMRARFEVEQQALARLDHPHVARFFDGGTTPDGRPFFAMEWIAGTTITDHCHAANPSLTERLRLFSQVCEAVQHAHRKGIIHRDLKPSNVMITTESGEAAVKVIDFGIAKAVEEPLTDRTLLTRAEEIVGTPVSMSPEQAAGLGEADLDARTDVYGLGILLYELLCNAHPFDESLPPDELRRRIREDDPARPSSRTTDSHLTRALRGDLDWIVMRCLEKKPERRYDSVSALADDLERHARNEPVVAGPPELSYRIGKFVRRNRLALAAGTVATLALLAGGFAIVIGLLTAREERANAVQSLEDSRREAAVAEAVSRFLSEELLTLEEPDGLVVADPRNETITLRTVLERASSRIDGRFDDQPEVEGVLRQSLATSFLAVGDLDEASRHAERAVSLLEGSLGEDDERFWRSLRLLASVHAARGRYDEAEVLLERIARLTGSRPDLVRKDPSLARESDLIRADLLRERGKVLAAEEAYGKILSTPELPPRIKAATLSGLAFSRQAHRDRSDVLAAHDEALSFAKEHLGEAHPLALEIARRHAKFLGDLERGSDEEIFRFANLAKEIRRQQEELLGTDHPAILRTRFDLDSAFGTVPPLAQESLQNLQGLVTAARNSYRDDHPDFLRYRVGLAEQHGRVGNHQEAREILVDLIETSRQSVGLSHPIVVEATRLLGEQQLALGQPQEALGSFREAVKRARLELSPACAERQRAIMSLGDALWESSETMPEAIEMFHAEWQNCVQALGLKHRRTAMYIDRAMVTFRHDRTGAAALAAAKRSFQVGGTPAATIRSLLQLSLASQWSLRHSFYAKPSIPLPEAYFRLLEVENVEETNGATRQIPPLIVKESSSWQHFVLHEDEPAPADWMENSFDASSWPSGAGPMGFNYPGIATDVRSAEEEDAIPVSLCLRHRFLVSEAAPERPLLLRVRCSAGAAIWLNGEELLRLNLPRRSALDASTRATGGDGPADEIDTQDFLVPAEALRPGENVLATRVFQGRRPSPALLFALRAHIDAPLPLDCLADFDPQPAQAHLHAWLPDLVPPIENAWHIQVECMTKAALGDWEGALDLSRTLKPRTPETTGRHRWFQVTALEWLARHEEAEKLLQSSIPPRDPSAPSELVDLTGFYNARFDEAWHIFKNGMMYTPLLRDFPAGIGEFGGVRFDARGLVQLSTPPFQQMVLRKFPEQVEGIPVNQPVARLHLLNACVPQVETGSRVATLVIHYEDGSKEEFPLRYLFETATYMIGADPDPDSVHVGWRGPDPLVPGGDKALHLATWENPRPETKVTSLDLRAALSPAALFVVGITVEKP